MRVTTGEDRLKKGKAMKLPLALPHPPSLRPLPVSGAGAGEKGRRLLLRLRKHGKKKMRNAEQKPFRIPYSTIRNHLKTSMDTPPTADRLGW